MIGLSILLTLTAPVACVDDGVAALAAAADRADTLRLGTAWEAQAVAGDDCGTLLAGYVLALTATASESEWERRRQGVDWLLAAQRHYPDEPRLYLGLGLLLYYRQSRTDARRMLDRAMDRADRGVPLGARERALVHLVRGWIHADYWRDWRSFGEVSVTSRGQWHCGRYQTEETDNFTSSSSDFGWLADLNLACPELFETNMVQYFRPRSALKRDDFEGLRTEFLAAFVTDTTFAAPLEALLGELVYLERWTEADSVVARLLAAFPEAPEPLLYLGLVRHAQGDERAASVAFARAFGRMDERTAAAFADIAALLPPEQAESFTTADSAARARFQAAYWNAFDPLYLTPANERRVEHYARIVAADLLFSSAARRERGRDTFAGAVWVRYGRPRSIREVTLATGRLAFWDYGPGPDVAMTRATAYQGYRPTDAAVEYTERLRRQSPQTYQPAFADSVEPLGVQVVRTVGADRAPSLLVLADWPDALAAAEGGLVLLDLTFLPVAQWRGGRPAAGGIRTDLQRVPPGAYSLAIELLDREHRRFARYRDTVTAIQPDSGFGVSDLVLARGAGGGSRATSFAELALDPRYAPAVRRGEALVVGWEAWRFDGADRLAYDVDLELQDASRRPVLARILGGLGVVGDREPASRISFRSERPLADGKTAEWVSLGTDLAPGDYLLVMRFRSGDREVLRERAVTITR